MVVSRRPLCTAPGRRARVALTGALAGVLAAGLLTGTAVAGSLPTATAAPPGYYQMPFPCGQMWTGTTRSYHSPSRYSVDFNRTDDYRARVVASAGGKVITAYASPSGGYGRWIRIDHGNGRTSLYAHLDETAVKVGQDVAQGQLIGYLGTSGNSTGPHLHYEQREGSRVVPARFDGSSYGYGTTTSRNCPVQTQTRGDVPLTGDVRAADRSEVVIFRPAKRAYFRIKRGRQPTLQIQLGGPQALPFLGDWDGDGNQDPGVRVPNLKQFRLLKPSGKRTKVTWGWRTDAPLAGDWDGDGSTELGLHRQGRRKVLLRGENGKVSRLWLGDRNDIAVTGDWNGDGRTDTAAFDPATATFTLRTFQANGKRSIKRVRYGTAGDLPIAGDWDGNGTTDLGVWRPSTGFFRKRWASSPTDPDARTRKIRFGRKR